MRQTLCVSWIGMRVHASDVGESDNAPSVPHRLTAPMTAPAAVHLAEFAAGLKSRPRPATLRVSNCAALVQAHARLHFGSHRQGSTKISRVGTTAVTVEPWTARL